jgi:hypothetical protein
LDFHGYSNPVHRLGLELHINASVDSQKKTLQLIYPLSLTDNT